MTKTLTFLNMIAAKIMKKYKNIFEMIKQMQKNMTCLNIIAAKQMKNHKR